jgi:integrase
VRFDRPLLRAALDIAVRDGLLSRNAATVVKRPGVERRDAAYLTAEQAQPCWRPSEGTDWRACSA